MGRRKKEETTQVKKAIAELLFNHKTDIKFYGNRPSSMCIAELLKDRYGYTVARQTVAQYIEEGIDSYRQTQITPDNDKIADIREAMQVQKSIWNNETTPAADRTKAANAWRALHKQQMEYEEQLANTQIKMAEVQRPNYLVSFRPPPLQLTCPKCGHVWNNLAEDPGKKEKRFIFKTDDIQKSFDAFITSDKKTDIIIEEVEEDGKDSEWK
jgi:hypothetical protein